MRFIFLTVALWNFMGGINFLFFPAGQAAAYGMPLGNRWELHFIGLVAFTFGAIYFSFFKKEPPKEYLYQVVIFGTCKILLFFSGLACYMYYSMPLKFMIIFSGGNLLMGSLFILYVVFRIRKEKKPLIE